MSLGIDLGTGGVVYWSVNQERFSGISRSLNQINLSDVAGHSEQDAKEDIILADALDELFANPCTASSGSGGG